MPPPRPSLDEDEARRYARVHEQTAAGLSTVVDSQLVDELAHRVLDGLRHELNIPTRPEPS